MSMILYMYRSAQEKTLFSRSLREQKFSNAKFRGENSVSSRRPFFFLSEFSRNSAQILRVNSRRHLRNVIRITLLNLNYLNVNYLVI